MVVYGGEEKLPAIKEKLPASIICFDLSSALKIAKRLRSSFICFRSYGNAHQITTIISKPSVCGFSM
jgi:hypothetical protein